jgi:ubiquinone/menaquinone biosynthesis C-methylase UbiE
MPTENPIRENLSSARARPPEGVKYEFTGARADLFTEALKEYPKARRDDLSLMRQYLEPRPGDHILGFGEGTGHFCRSIAEAVGPQGKYVITDPSPELFRHVPQAVLDLPQVFTELTGVEDIDFAPASFDKAWACGAFHHCPNQTRAIERIHRSLKPGGRMVILDIFQGTPVAKHFDSCVARYCETGHEVQFLSEEFAKTICLLAGFDEAKIEIIDVVPHRFTFDSLWDLGRFIWKVHALTRMPGTEEQRIAKVVESVQEHLPVVKEGDQYVLHFDQRGVIATK